MDDPALVDEQLRLALAPGAKATKVGGAEMLEKVATGRHRRLGQPLTHMGNVEQLRRFAGVRCSVRTPANGSASRRRGTAHAAPSLNTQGWSGVSSGRGSGMGSAQSRKEPALRVERRMAA